jgi:O-antigen/teichoic acid export membrane protein
MNLHKQLAKNTLIQVIGKIISTILGLFAIALITRYLGPEGFGKYTTIITFLTFFAVASDFGLTLVTVQMISGLKDKLAENKILNNLFGFRLLSVSLFLILAPITVFFFPYPAAIKIGVIIGFIAFIFPALNQVIVGLFQKRLDMKGAVIAEIISRIFLLSGIILTKKLNLGLNGILLSTVFSAAANFISHYIFSLKFVTIKLEFDWQIWKKIINKSWPLAITIVLNLIYLRTDILFLSLFESEYVVGLYGASYKIVDVLATIPFMFAGLVLPILTAAWIEKKQKYFYKILQKSFDFMIILAIPLVIGAQFLSKPLLTFIAGPDFSSAGIILQILIFAVGAIFIGTIFSHAVVALNKQKSMIGFYLFTSISSLIAYLIFIPRFSYFGAAGVTIYSETLIAIFSAYCVWKYSKFLIKINITLKSILSGIIMGLFLYFFAKPYQTSLVGLILVIIFAGLLYFTVLFLLGGLNKDYLKAITKRQDKNTGSIYSSLNL